MLLETEQDPAELSLENQIKQAEQRMKELQNEMKSDAHVSETSDDLEEKALNESIFEIFLFRPLFYVISSLHFYVCQFHSLFHSLFY